MAELAEEIATVSFIDDSYAYLKAESASACSSCAAKSSCGARTISKPSSSYNLRVKNTLNLKEGDSVIVGLSSNKLLFGSVVLYILPLLMLFLFAFIGKTYFGEVASIFAGIFGLLAGLLFIRHSISKGGVEKQFEPIIIRRNEIDSCRSSI